MSEPVTNIAEAPARRSPPRRFLDGGFSMTGEVMMMEYVKDDKLPMVMRMWMLCQARANRYGHCAFLPSELRELLGDPGGQNIRGAMRKLKAQNMIAQESTTLCVVLDCRALRREDGTNPQCREPSHLDKADRMWMAPQGFEPTVGHWQETLSSPERMAKARRVIAGLASGHVNSDTTVTDLSSAVLNQTRPR